MPLYCGPRVRHHVVENFHVSIRWYSGGRWRNCHFRAFSTHSIKSSTCLSQKLHLPVNPFLYRYAPFMLSLSLSPFSASHCLLSSSIPTFFPHHHIVIISSSQKQTRRQKYGDSTFHFFLLSLSLPSRR